MDVATDTLSHLNADELREMVQSLRQTVSFKQATIDKLTHENALLKRLKFAAQALTRFVDDGHLPVDNNYIENQIRPIAMTCS